MTSRDSRRGARGGSATAAPHKLRVVSAVERLASLIERVVVGVAQTLAWLVFGVVAMLYAQMPVRDLLVGGGILSGQRPQEAINDYGQLMHATVFLVGIPYAIVTDRHVRFDVFIHRFSPRTRWLIEAFGHLVFVLPWTFLLAYWGLPHVWRSVQVGETFPDTGNPGYTLMRLAFALFIVLLFAASIARLLRSLSEAFAGARLAVVVADTQVAALVPQEAPRLIAADALSAEDR